MNFIVVDLWTGFWFYCIKVKLSWTNTSNFNQKNPKNVYSLDCLSNCHVYSAAIQKVITFNFFSGLSIWKCVNNSIVKILNSYEVLESIVCFIVCEFADAIDMKLQFHSQAQVLTNDDDFEYICRAILAN